MADGRVRVVNGMRAGGWGVGAKCVYVWRGPRGVRGRTRREVEVRVLRVVGPNASTKDR